MLAPADPTAIRTVATVDSRRRRRRPRSAAGATVAGATPLAGVGLFALVARPAPRDDDEVIADAAARRGRDADVAVVVVGLTEEQETEAVDKTTLRLPGEQDELVRAVAAAARRTVVVVNAATPVLMPWLDEVDAILWAGPARAGGRSRRGRGPARRRSNLRAGWSRPSRSTTARPPPGR